MPLIVETQSGRTEYPLSEGVCVIGRDPHCEISIPDASLSRRHAQLSVVRNEVVLRDLNSKNGTYLGSQRIREAHLRPGVRLRIGNVWLYVKSADDSIPGGVLTHPPEPAVTEPPTPVSLDAVPDDEAFDEEEEPTPIDAGVAESAAADVPSGGTRLVVRDNRWFVQDSATGTEVEIVPVGRATSPAAEPPPFVPADGGTNLPALITQPGMSAAPARIEEPPLSVRPDTIHTAPVTAVRSRRFYILLAVSGLAVILTVLLLLMTEKKPPPLMSLTTYYRNIDNAIADSEAGDKDHALGILKKLRSQKVQNNPQLAQIMEKAIQADALLQTDFQNSWEGAQSAWEEVRDSSWQSEHSKEVAEERLLWILTECSNMVRVNDARRLAEEGDLAQCLDKASSVGAESIFRKEAEELIQSTRDTVVAKALEQADRDQKDRAWGTAIAALEDVVKYKPEMAEELKPRIATLRGCERDAAAIEEAKTLARNGDVVGALGKLRAIGTDSPYRAEVTSLTSQWTDTRASQRARGAYNSGDAARALKILEGADLKNTELYSRIGNVKDAFEAAEKAMNDGEFIKAEEAIGKVQQLETARDNYYAAQVGRMKAGMAKRKAELADKLLGEADSDIRERHFADARQKLERVLILDPARSMTVLNRMQDMRKEALVDYNRALNMWRTQPKEAKILLQEVKDRLPVIDDYYVRADAKIRQIEAAENAPDEEDTQP